MFKKTKNYEGKQIDMGGDSANNSSSHLRRTDSTRHNQLHPYIPSTGITHSKLNLSWMNNFPDYRFEHQVLMKLFLKKSSKQQRQPFDCACHH